LQSRSFSRCPGMPREISRVNPDSYNGRAVLARFVTLDTLARISHNK